MATRHEITKKFAREYARANRAEKGAMLDALVETTGWTRDHARRAIRVAAARKGAARDVQRRPRPKKYSYDALIVLQEVWRLSGQPSGKYLAAVMDDTLERLVRFGELGKVAPRVRPEVLDELRSMSAATIDRYLKPHKDAAYPSALSGTKPSHILRSSIPTRTSMDEPITVPGFLELDTVAHCGHTLKGEFLRTLTATDPLTGWTMLRSIRNNAFLHVHGALEWITAQAPVPVAGVDFDNGSEFINWGVIAWCDDHDIPVTRARPYQHNDNAHVEQRNGDWVRKHAFRYRYETEAELALLNDLWALVMARKNHLLPCVKATGWTTTKAGRKKRIYDPPRTPYQRLLDAGVLDEKIRSRLETEHAALNPAKVTRAINKIQNQLIDLAAARTRGTRPAA
ncbi:integrase [Nocardioides terrisoli]|uniref:integrase n=1 Tax=Nocardioides terrisoli TaxID=3388267 RepID=UPI00287B8C35|nr:integrase [Nocardioides marmorisolisilvae]